MRFSIGLLFVFIVSIIVAGVYQTLKLKQETQVSMPVKVEKQSKYLNVDQMSCEIISKRYSKDELSLLDKLTKKIVEHIKECSLTFTNVRILKSRIRLYFPQYYYSVKLFAGKVTEIGDYIQYCNIGVASDSDKESQIIVIRYDCDYLDGVLND